MIIFWHHTSCFLIRGSRLVELSEGRSHSLEEFHKSEMMLQAKRFSWCWSCWMPVETSCCFLMLFYFSILLQAMTSRVGKMLGNMMDSGAMKVLINDPDITLITIITIIIVIILLLGCPRCIFDCVRQNQHSQLHLLSQQCHQDFPIWLENQSVTLVIYLYIYTCHSSNTNII